MSKKNVIILVSSILVLLVAIAIFAYAMIVKNNENTAQSETSIPLVEAPIETVSEYFFDIDGNELKFENFSDNPIVVLLWKSNNSKSYTMINLITKYYEEYKDNINFLAINVNEADIDLDLINDVKAANFKIPMYFDTDLTLENKFNYTKLPEIIFISQNGEIEKEAVEDISEDAFLANLEILKNE